MSPRDSTQMSVHTKLIFADTDPVEIPPIKDAREERDLEAKVDKVLFELGERHKNGNILRLN